MTKATEQAPMTRRSFAIFCALSALSALCPTARGDSAATREYQVKAAFVYHFAQFVEWPQDAFAGRDAPFVIAVVGDNPFGASLEQAVRGKRASGRPIVVRYFPDPGAIQTCHILFVAASERGRIGQVLQNAGPTVLTVSDIDEFTARGGILRFFPEENKIRFEANLQAARQSRLKISSKLLKLARIYGQ